MAIDPRLSLAVQPVNIQSAIAGGLANRQTARESGIRERILGQQETIGAQGIEQNRRAQAIQTADFTVKLFEGLKGVPLDQRASIVAQQLPQLEAMGLPAQEILATDLTDQGIDRGLAALKPLLQKKQQDGDFGFGATQTIKKPDGSLVSITQVRDPKSGDVRVVEIPIEGQLVSGIGETAAERSAREIGTAVGKTTGTGVAQTDVLAGREEVLRPGQIQTAEELQEVELTGSAKKQAETIRQTRSAQFINEMATRNQESARQQVQLAEAMKLSEGADQGLTGIAKLQLSKLPGLQGIDVGDTAALDSALKSIAIAKLQAFKGPTTDFEFNVVQDISGSILGSQAANQARLASLQRAAWFQRKEFDQAQAFTSQGGDPNSFAFNFDEQIETGKGVYSLRQIQDTAVANHLSIEEVLSRLN